MHTALRPCLASLLFGLLFCHSVAFGFDSGLEMANSMKLSVIIECSDNSDPKVGLTEDLIRAKLELQLRRNGISPASEPTDGVLSIGLTTVGTAFSVHISFKRIVSYSVDGHTYSAGADMWSQTILGTHRRNNSFILKRTADLLDEFINAYLKANAM